MNVVNIALFKEQLMVKGHLGTIITCYFSQVKASFYILHFPCAYYWRSLSFHVWISDRLGSNDTQKQTSNQTETCGAVLL